MGDCSFSINNLAPSLIIVNQFKEFYLLNIIKNFFNLDSNKINIKKVNSSSNLRLEIKDIEVLKNIVLPIFSKINNLKSKKLKEFNEWSILVNFFYFGYHLLPEGISLFYYIKNNNFVLEDQEFENKINNLFLLPSPYEVRKGIRFIRGTNKLVSEKLNIFSIDNFNNYLSFSSLTECSKILQIDRSKIKNCLLTGEKYKNFKFIFQSNNFNN